MEAFAVGILAFVLLGMMRGVGMFLGASFGTLFGIFVVLCVLSIPIILILSMIMPIVLHGLIWLLLIYFIWRIVRKKLCGPAQPAACSTCTTTAP